jgi:hypothetical protein
MHGEDPPSNVAQMPDDDRHKFMKFEPSVGQHAQKSAMHLTGDGSFATPQQAKQMFDERGAEQKIRRRIYENEAAKNKAFNQNQHAMVREIQAINDKAMKERWK